MNQDSFISMKDKSLFYRWVNAPILSKEESAEMDKYFELKVIESPKMFNGKGISCTRYKINDNSIELDICETDFKRNIWSRGTNKKIIGTQIIGTNIILRDLSKGCIYLDVRSNDVMYGKNSYGAFGGMVDYVGQLENFNASQFLNYLFDEAVRELKEETSLPDSELSIDSFFDYGLLVFKDLEKISMGFLWMLRSLMM